MSRLLSRMSYLPPLAALAVLLGFSRWLPNRVVIDEAAVQRKAEVAAALDAVPYFIGEWIGRDEPVPPEAQKLLRPNAIFSRMYQKPGGPRVQVLLVHCSDARDMIGHYPPVCYPSSGWIAEPVADAEGHTVQLDLFALPVRPYRFRRVRDGGHEDQIRVLGAFILPDGNVTRDISDINRQSERLAVSALGVAQLQVITAGSMTDAEAEKAAGELLGGMSDLFSALRVGQRSGS